MAISFTNSHAGRRLAMAQCRVNSGDSWVDIPNFTAIYWRVETAVVFDYERINTTGNLSLYQPLGHGRGRGRRLRGVLWTMDPMVMETLVQHSHLNSDFAATISPISNTLQFRFAVNTGIDTANLRFLIRTIQPVIFGTGFGQMDWLQTMPGADRGTRLSFPIPFRAMFNTSDVHFNTSNINAAGMYTNFVNTL